MYNRVGGDSFTRCQQEKRSGQMERLEYLAVHYLAGVRHKNSIMALGEQFLSAGQQTFGYSAKQRVDLMLLLPESRVVVYQVHETLHVEEGHLASCPMNKSVGAVDTLRFNVQTRLSDELNGRLARALTGTGLMHIDFRTITECELTHGAPLTEELVYRAPNNIPHCAPRGKIALTKALEEMMGQNFVGLPTWMSTTPVVKEKNMVDFILNSPEAGGYVVFQGGREQAEDFCAEVTGLCLQRSIVDHVDLGEGAIQLMIQRLRDSKKVVQQKGQSDSEFELAMRKSAEKELDKLGARGYTVLRSSYDGVTCMHVNQLRFLVRERAFADFKVLHYIHYAPRKYLSREIHAMLARRFNLKRQKACSGELKLESECLKLDLNMCAIKHAYSLANYNVL